MLMVGLWLYRRLPAHCRNHHMAALLTAPLLDQVRQILRLPSRTLFGSPFPCFSDHDSNKIEFMGQSCKLRWKLQVFLWKHNKYKLAGESLPQASNVLLLLGEQQHLDSSGLPPP